MSKHLTTTTEHGTYTTYTYGEHGHNEYHVTFFVTGDDMCASLYCMDAEHGSYEVAAADDLEWSREDMREAVAQLMAAVVRSGHDLSALSLLADLAKDVR